MKGDGGILGSADALFEGPVRARPRDRCAEACARRFQGRTVAELEAMVERLDGPVPGGAS